MDLQLHNRKVAQHICRICGVSTATRCQRCKAAFYCGDEHAEQDQPAHSSECTPHTSNTLPDVQTFDVLLFAHNEDQPRMVKIPWKWDSSGQQTLLRPWEKSWYPLYIASRYPNGPAMPGHRVFVAFHNDMFQMDGSPKNRCMERFCDGELGQVWKDHVWVLRTRRVSSGLYGDLVWDEDVPLLKTYLKEHGKNDPGPMTISWDSSECRSQ
ncbi:hypothetical protein EIP91_008555 [Steccherinum ochraceum]|uniref:MYND-type domain-containing protein n=1 Tax=Steccherinum ochraceum TaxID=92696 RepID=A0A4R0R8B9_9APHY|nr:hypothetical protein EIP91_008555 [Steccherinum ochraceum]